MLSFSILYWDLIKFAQYHLKEGIGGEREGNLPDNFNNKCL
jgi:hypothetical protein